MYERTTTDEQLLAKAKFTESDAHWFTNDAIGYNIAMPNSPYVGPYEDAQTVLEFQVYNEREELIGHAFSLDEAFALILADITNAKPQQRRPEILSIKVFRVADTDADLSHLDQFENAPEGSEEAGYYIADQERKSKYGTSWWMEGVFAEAEIAVPEGNGVSRLHTITSGGLWGIESDSNDSYFKEVGAEQLADLKDQLNQFNVDTTGWEQLNIDPEPQYKR